MTPMGVPVTVHMVVAVPIIVAEIIRRTKLITEKRVLSTSFLMFERLPLGAFGVNSKDSSP
jgi:hypothetical protein